MSTEHEQSPEQALAWIKDGKGAALATVIQTWGSAPRPVGSQLAISSEAEIYGSVSGGCVEGAVVAEALDALESGENAVLEYGVSNEEAFAVGLACGGTIRILVEPIGTGKGIPLQMLEDIVERRANRTPVALSTSMADWQREMLNYTDKPAFFDAEKSGFTNRENTHFLCLYAQPLPLRMVVVGAVHIAQPLIEIANLAGYDTTLVDPREAFASSERFPDVTLIKEWPDQALNDLNLTSRTAVVTLTHDPKLDDPAIKIALQSEIFYLGCLGSKRTHAKRVLRLEAEGFTAQQINRIHAPVGADIGSKTPAEIAISIMAQITERLRRPDSRQ